MKKPTTLEQAFDVVTEHLPDGWIIQIGLAEGLRSFDLLSPDDEVFDEPFEDEDCSCQIAMLIRRVNYARQSDGLENLDFSDEYP